MIYRLITRGTVEETLIQRAKKKMMLDHVVVRKMAAKEGQQLKQAELDSILRFGTAELFEDEDDGAQNQNEGKLIGKENC